MWSANKTTQIKPITQTSAIITETAVVSGVKYGAAGNTTTAVEPDASQKPSASLMKKATRPEYRFITNDQARSMAASPNSLAVKSKSYKESYEMAEPAIDDKVTRAKIHVCELYQSYFSLIPVQGLGSRFLIPTSYQLITYQMNSHLAGKVECSLCKKDNGERLFKTHITHIETREHFVNAAAAVKSSSDSSGFKKLKKLLGADKKEVFCEICPDSNFTSWMDHILHSTQQKQRLEMILVLYSDIKKF